MAKSVEEIIREQMPNVRIVRKVAADAGTKRAVSRTSRSMEALKEKYGVLGHEFSTKDASGGAGNSDDDVQIVTVVPADQTGPGGPGAKSVVVSTKEGKIIGQQG